METLWKIMANEGARALESRSEEEEEREDRVVQFATEEETIPNTENVPIEQNVASEPEEEEETPTRPTPPNLQLFRGKSIAIRSQNKLNIDTGVSVDRECMVEVVTGLTEPMNPMERRRRSFLGTAPARQASTRNLMEQPQYRLRSKTNGVDAESYGIGIGDTGDKFMIGALSRMFTNYIHWSFTTSLCGLLSSLTAMFFMFTTLWAIWIAGVGWYQPNCIYVGLKDFEEGGSNFIDAFAISWTTFSTVGYGLTGPTVSNVDRCIFLNMFTAVEAFFGVLYAGFAGAVIFGKITRMNSTAKVVWSDPIVVRYGSGVSVENKDKDTTTDSNGETKTVHEDDEEDDELLPCPILEFRVANQFFARDGGEIANASVTVWASTLADLAPVEIREAANLPRRGRRSRQQEKEQPSPKRSRVRNFMAARSKSPKGRKDDQKMTVEQALEEGRASMLKDLSYMKESSKHLTLTEDHNNVLIPQLIYSKLDIETDSHPFFKRMWIVRHRLDDKSPLLDIQAREMILANGGFWPSELNDHQSLRNHLGFNEIMVTLSGTDHVSGNTQYSQKTYDFVDVNIGYRFANTLVFDKNIRSLGMDLTLINDVLEQHGGGAEPFTDVIEGDPELLEDNQVVLQEEDSRTPDEKNSGKSGKDIERPDPTKED